MKGGGVLLLAVLASLMMTLTTTDAAPPTVSGTEYAVNNQRDFRSRRGFKTVGLQTARGFGKRASISSIGQRSISDDGVSSETETRRGHKPIESQYAWGFGKRTPSSSGVFQYSTADEDDMDSEADTFPVEWLVQYLQKKPSVTRYLVERLLDHNGDGQVTSSELVSSLQLQE